MTRCYVRSWSESSDGVSVSLTTQGNERHIQTGRLILAVGAGYNAFPSLRALNLHPVKGQTIRAKCPDGLRDSPNVTGPGYLAHDGDDIVLGSTFEHGVFDPRPTRQASDDIVEKLAPIVPDVRGLNFSATAGIRVTVPGTRLPMLGPVTDGGRVWIYTGLGSKGLLMSALLSSRLPGYLRDPDSISPRMRPSPAADN